MKTWTVITMMVAAALIVAGSAAAQGPQGKQGHPGKGLKQLFQEADANKDGKATFEEVKAVRPGMTQERYSRLDRNHDSVLTQEDATLGRRQFMMKMKQADANGDGKTSLEEAKAACPKMDEALFNRLDRNHDGALNQEDRPANGPGKQGQMRGKGAGKGACAMGGGQGKHQMRGKGACGQGQGQGVQAQRQQRRQEWRNKMQQADTDKDGNITYAEIKAVCPNMTEDRFKNRDRNGDGALSPEDRKSKN